MAENNPYMSTVAVVDLMPALRAEITAATRPSDAARIAELESLLLTALALHGGEAHTHSETEWRAAARKALNLDRS